MLAQCLDVAGPADDVAVIVARLRPPRLQLVGPAVPERLRAVRADIDRWARLSALPAVVRENLQLTVGEAVSNSVEHGYAGGLAGDLTVCLQHTRDGVRAEVRDQGVWRPAPPDPGRRGNGLAVIDALAVDVELDTTGPGTRTAFTVALPATVPVVAAHPGVAAGGGLTVREHIAPDGTVRMVCEGELDLATVDALSTAVARHLTARPAVPLVLDLRGLGYLSSAGVGLLVELRHGHPGRVEILADGGGPAARVLALAGIDVLDAAT